MSKVLNNSNPDGSNFEGQVVQVAYTTALDQATVVPIGGGGTGSTTQQAAVNAITGATTNLVNRVLTIDSNGNAVWQGLGTISGVGEVNVQSDWNVTDDTADAFIKNKPNVQYTSAIPDVSGATGSTGGAGGLVPAPIAGDQVKFLRGDGTFATGPVGPT